MDPARLSDIIVKAHTGVALTDEEKQILQEAMKSVAPASHEYQGLNDAYNAASALPTNPAAPRGPGIYLDGPPTMDWAADLGNIKDGGRGVPSLDWASGHPTMDWAAGDPASGWEHQAQPGDSPSWHPEATTAGAAANPQYDAPTQTDPSPLPPNTPTKNIQYEDPNGGIPGPTIAAGYGNDPGDFGSDDVADVSAVNFPQGYSFSNSNETAVDLFKYNPDLFNRNITENVLGQDNSMSPFWSNKTKAAMNMANYGLLGRGNGRQDLNGGPTTSTGQLAATEDFMKQFAAPGVQTVDPSDVYRQIFQKAENTDWSKEQSRQYQGQAMGPEEITQVTNEALLTSMAFSNPETEAWMSSLLENAAQEYMMYLAQGGDTSISYPKFLDQTMDFSQLL